MMTRSSGLKGLKTFKVFLVCPSAGAKQQSASKSAQTEFLKVSEREKLFYFSRMSW